MARAQLAHLRSRKLGHAVELPRALSEHDELRQRVLALYETNWPPLPSCCLGDVGAQKQMRLGSGGKERCEGKKGDHGAATVEDSVSWTTQQKGAAEAI